MTNTILAVIRFTDRMLIVGAFYNGDDQSITPNVLILLPRNEQDLLIAETSLKTDALDEVTKQSVQWALSTQILENLSFDVMASSYCATKEVFDVVEASLLQARLIAGETSPVVH